MVIDFLGSDTMLKFRKRERVESVEKMKKERIGEERECSETLNISYIDYEIVSPIYTYGGYKRV